MDSDCNRASWSIIAAQLPGRTDLAIKNYWNNTLKKRFPAARGGAARRRHRPAACTSSDAATPDLALVVYSSEESTTTGSSSHVGADKPVLAGSPSMQMQVQPPTAAAGGNGASEEPIAAVPISAVGSLPLEKAPPPTPGDQTGEMDVACAPMSPLPLASMEPVLACIIDFDDVVIFLPWFDD